MKHKGHTKLIAYAHPDDWGACVAVARHFLDNCGDKDKQTLSIGVDDKYLFDVERTKLGVTVVARFVPSSSHLNEDSR